MRRGRPQEYQPKRALLYEQAQFYLVWVPKYLKPALDHRYAESLLPLLPHGGNPHRCTAADRLHRHH